MKNNTDVYYININEAKLHGERILRGICYNISYKCDNYNKVSTFFNDFFLLLLLRLY